MSAAGYSKRTLLEKLGIQPGHCLLLANAPTGYHQQLGELPPGAGEVRDASHPIDFVQLFVTDERDLAEQFPLYKAALAFHGQLWVSWPKGKSKVSGALNENVVRRIGLENGLVDVKVIAVDAVWSGLKFVYRLKDRG